LVWLLICLGALTVPRAAWVNDKAIVVSLAAGALVWTAMRKRRHAQTQPEAGELIR
jgi:hypothetical protein